MTANEQQTQPQITTAEDRANARNAQRLETEAAIQRAAAEEDWTGNGSAMRTMVKILQRFFGGIIGADADFTAAEILQPPDSLQMSHDVAQLAQVTNVTLQRGNLLTLARGQSCRVAWSRHWYIHTSPPPLCALALVIRLLTCI